MSYIAPLDLSDVAFYSHTTNIQRAFRGHTLTELYCVCGHQSLTGHSGLEPVWLNITDIPVRAAPPEHAGAILQLTDSDFPMSLKYRAKSEIAQKVT